MTKRSNIIDGEMFRRARGEGKTGILLLHNISLYCAVEKKLRIFVYTCMVAASETPSNFRIRMELETRR